MSCNSGSNSGQNDSGVSRQGSCSGGFFGSMFGGAKSTSDMCSGGCGQEKCNCNCALKDHLKGCCGYGELPKLVECPKTAPGPAANNNCGCAPAPSPVNNCAPAPPPVNNCAPAANNCAATAPPASVCRPANVSCSRQNTSGGKCPPMPASDVSGCLPNWLCTPPQTKYPQYQAPPGAVILPISSGGRSNQVGTSDSNTNITTAADLQIAQGENASCFADFTHSFGNIQTQLLPLNFSIPPIPRCHDQPDCDLRILGQLSSKNEDENENPKVEEEKGDGISIEEPAETEPFCMAVDSLCTAVEGLLVRVSLHAMAKRNQNSPKSKEKSTRSANSLIQPLLMALGEIKQSQQTEVSKNVKPKLIRKSGKENLRDENNNDRAPEEHLPITPRKERVHHQRRARSDLKACCKEDYQNANHLSIRDFRNVKSYPEVPKRSDFQNARLSGDNRPEIPKRSSVKAAINDYRPQIPKRPESKVQKNKEKTCPEIPRRSEFRILSNNLKNFRPEIPKRPEFRIPKIEENTYRLSKNSKVEGNCPEIPKRSEYRIPKADQNYLPEVPKRLRGQNSKTDRSYRPEVPKRSQFRIPNVDESLCHEVPKGPELQILTFEEDYRPEVPKRTNLSMSRLKDRKSRPGVPKTSDTITHVDFIESSPTTPNHSYLRISKYENKNARSAIAKPLDPKTSEDRVESRHVSPKRSDTRNYPVHINDSLHASPNRTQSAKSGKHLVEIPTPENPFVSMTWIISPDVGKPRSLSRIRSRPPYSRPRPRTVPSKITPSVSTQTSQILMTDDELEVSGGKCGEGASAGAPNVANKNCPMVRPRCPGIGNKQEEPAASGGFFAKISSFFGGGKK